MGMDGDGDADAVPLNQVRREDTARPSNPGPAAAMRRRLHEHESAQANVDDDGDTRPPPARQYDNVVFEPAQNINLNHAWEEASPPYVHQDARMTFWDEHKYTCVVALIVLGAIAVVLRTPSLFSGKDQWMAVMVLGLVAAWIFHTVCPFI